MLSELGRMLDPITFHLILQTIIHSMHQINLLDSYLLVPKLPKKQKLMREVKIVHQVLPNSDLMKDWADDSATLYLVATIYYWIEKTISKLSNMKKVAVIFQVKLTALRHCINGRIYEGAQLPRREKPEKHPKM